MRRHRIFHNTLIGLALLPLAIGLSGCGKSGLSSKEKINQLIVWEDQGYTANEKMFAFLFDDDESVRVRAALALGRVNDTLALDTLAYALRTDESPKVRAMAAFALGAWQWRVAIDELLAALRTEEDPEVLVAILQSLARNYAREQHAEYAHLLSHPDPRVRAQTAMTLDMVNWRDDTDSILVLLDDPNPDVRWAAMHSLARMNQESSARRAFAFLSNPDPRIRMYAYKTAASFAIPGIADSLRRGLDDPDPRVRAAVADAMHQIRDTILILDIIPYMLSEADPRVKQRMGRALGNLWRESASGSLMQLFDDPDPGVREECAKIICNRRDLLCTNLLAPAAGDPSPRVRFAFLETLDRLQRYGAVDTTVMFPLLRKLMEDPSAWVRARAVQTYSQFGQLDFEAILSDLLHDSNSHAVSIAVSLIGTLRIDYYTDSLRAIYQRHRDDPRPDVKWAVLAAGANMLPTIHIDSIRQDLLDWGMADPDRLVRWYTIAVAQKFRQDRRLGLGVYRTDLTPDNVDELLFPYASPPRLRFNTTKGVFVAELDTEWAPRTARHMIAAVRDGVYNDMPFNDAQIGASVQTGDKTGDGTLLPDETVRDEYSPLRAERGSLFWLAQTRDGGRGTFGIALDRLPYLDWRFPIFGRIVEGIEVADDLTMSDTIRTVEVIIPES